MTVRPAKARASFVMNHRYLLDAIVDPKRYRYSGPAWLLRLIWTISPKPDLIVLLDADPRIIWERKKEVALEETIRQRDGYRKLIEPMRIAQDCGGFASDRAGCDGVDESCWIIWRGG